MKRAGTRLAPGTGDTAQCRMDWRPLGAGALRTARRLAAAVDSALLPRCCVFCGTGCQPGEPDCCRGCGADLPWIDAQCPGCAAPLDKAAAPGLRCGACQQHPTGFAVACAPFHYRFPIDAAIRALKFGRRLEYAPALAAMLEPALQRLPADVDALLPKGRSALRYTGSLTTPPCSEGVRWLVLTDPVELSAEQIAAFTAIFSGNNRPVQPLGERTIAVDRVEG